MDYITDALVDQLMKILEWAPLTVEYGVMTMNGMVTRVVWTQKGRMYTAWGATTKVALGNAILLAESVKEEEK